MVVAILVLMILNSDFNVWDHKTSLNSIIYYPINCMYQARKWSVMY